MKKKVIKISLFAIFITILTVFGIFNLINNISTAANGETSTQSSAKPGTLMAGEDDPSTYSYKTDFGTWIYEPYTYQGKWYVPEKEGYQVYCISPDDHIKYAWEITWDELDLANAEMDNPRRASHGHATKYAYHYTRSTHTANGYGVEQGEGKDKETGSRSNDFRTPIKWEPTSTTDLTHAMAYVVSDETLGAYTDEKQLAIWKLGIADGTIAESTKGKTDGTSSLQGEANNYSKYHSKVEAKSGLDPKDLTSIDGLTTEIDQTSDKYIVGPYKIT